MVSWAHFSGLRTRGLSQVPSSLVPVGLLPEGRELGPARQVSVDPQLRWGVFSASDTSLSRCDHQQHQSPSPWVPRQRPLGAASGPRQLHA